MNVLEVVLGLIIVLLLGVLLAHYLLDRRARTKGGPPADRQVTTPIFRDDDRYWYGGFFYYNPDDPDLLVPRRYTFGQTLNWGHPRAKWFLIGVLVVLLLTSLLPVLVQASGLHGVHGP